MSVPAELQIAPRSDAVCNITYRCAYCNGLVTMSATECAFVPNCAALYWRRKHPTHGSHLPARSSATSATTYSSRLCRCVNSIYLPQIINQQLRWVCAYLQAGMEKPDLHFKTPLGSSQAQTFRFTSFLQGKGTDFKCTISDKANFEVEPVVKAEAAPDANGVEVSNHLSTR